MKAEELRKRLDGISQLKDDVPGEHVHGFPPRSYQENAFSELFAVVSDIIIYLEDQEKADVK